MTERLRLMHPPDIAVYFDNNLYPLKWKPWPEDIPPDMSGLPSIDRAMYLFNSVKFHLKQHYSFYNDDTFAASIQDFYYGNAQEKANNRLWFVQFLLVLAFGTAFLTKSRNPQEPPGAKYFVRAMALMPDLTTLWKDSVLAIEVLILAGIYLYSIDKRERAHVYVSPYHAWDL